MRQIVEDWLLIKKIAMRMANIYARHDRDVHWSYIASELTMVHEEIIPLRLKDMLDGRDSDLTHDVCGIHQHLDIAGKPRLTGGFLPRYAAVN